jgi:Uma2 family endonuclease
MQTQEQLYTVVEFEKFSAQHTDWPFELIHGEIVEKMPTEEHGKLAALIAHISPVLHLAEQD